MQQHFHYVSMNRSAIFFTFSCVYCLHFKINVNSWVPLVSWHFFTFVFIFRMLFSRIWARAHSILLRLKSVSCVSHTIHTCFSDTSLNSIDRNHYFRLKIACDFGGVSPTSFKSSFSTTGYKYFRTRNDDDFFLIDDLIVCDNKN